MSEIPDEEESRERKRDKVAEYLQKSYNKGELALKHAVGLGAEANVIPITPPVTNGAPRPVEVGWHPVGGLAGKWFAEETGLGKMITAKTHKYPDPTQHWAVLVGDFAHQLWMDENFDVIYVNGRIDPKEWKTYSVGETCFNDDAIRQTGEAVIASIRNVRPRYNLITNNCQTYVTQLLDVIERSKVKQFATTLAVYHALFSSDSKVADLFVDKPANADTGEGTQALAGQELGIEGGTASIVHYHAASEHYPDDDATSGHSVLLAQQVMNDNTPQLDSEEQLSRGADEEDEHKTHRFSEASKSFFRKFRK